MKKNFKTEIKSVTAAWHGAGYCGCVFAAVAAHTAAELVAAQVCSCLGFRDGSKGFSH